MRPATVIALAFLMLALLGAGALQLFIETR
jgi:hypothetical protein